MSESRAWSEVAPPGAGTKVALALVHSNVFISLAATSWVVTTIVLADLPVDPLPLCIVFAVTLFVYSLNRFTDIDEDEFNVPGRATFTKQYGRATVLVGLLGYLLVVAVGIYRDIPRVELLLAPLVVISLYSIVGLKRLLLVKNLLVGLAWAGIPLGVGVYYGVARTTEILVLTGYVLAMLTIAAVIFDLKDIVGDRREGIRTIPRVVGTRWTRLGCAAATICVGLALVLVVAIGLVGPRYLVLLALSGYVLAYSLLADPDATPLFYGFVVDGEHVFLAAIVVALEAGGFL
ncbi:UbiA family prenyltransferase [Halovivax limisalsi]|uniref:UbiA family prenyltransferase n=1 Tax=Halovivax limisalsi TaxID=1453760 RepID=UPI001FFC9278|nr:UbiA family prenyltransferase [Halovivax limisalsi]